MNFQLAVPSIKTKLLFTEFLSSYDLNGVVSCTV